MDGDSMVTLALLLIVVLMGVLLRVFLGGAGGEDAENKAKEETENRKLEEDIKKMKEQEERRKKRIEEIQNMPKEEQIRRAILEQERFLEEVVWFDGRATRRDIFNGVGWFQRGIPTEFFDEYLKLLRRKKVLIATFNAKDGVSYYDIGTHRLQESDFRSLPEEGEKVPSIGEKRNSIGINEIDKMEGHQFERYCAELLRKLNFTDVEITKGSGDQGVDVIAVKEGVRYAIQCKCYSSHLGNTPIQEVNAGKQLYHCHVAVVLTNQYFTSGAKELAEVTGVLLWDRDELMRMIEKAKKKK